MFGSKMVFVLVISIYSSGVDYSANARIGVSGTEQIGQYESEEKCMEVAKKVLEFKDVKGALCIPAPKE